MENCQEITKTEGDIQITEYIRDGVIIAIRRIERHGFGNYTIIYEIWYRDGKKHRDGGPAVTCYEYGKKVVEFWYRDGEPHRDDGPAAIHYNDNQIVCEDWYRNGKQHRDDGPTVINYENGQIVEEIWYRDGELHRVDGPASIRYENGKIMLELWYRDGTLGGPVLAYVWLNDIGNFENIYIYDGCSKILDEFRDVVKSPLALEIMRPLPIPIRDAIYEHYCHQ